MSSAFLGEIRIMGFTFPPRNWAMCNGQLIPITQNTALFSILGTSFGGNGTTNFALPNLQAQAAMGVGDGPSTSPRVIGEVVGEPTVTLTNLELPQHSHAYNAATPALPIQQTSTPSAEAYLGPSNPQLAYADTTTTVVQFAPQALTPAGQGQPHNNVQPLLAVNFCIATSGVFPVRN